MSLFNSSFNHLRRQFDAANTLLHDAGELNPNRFRNRNLLSFNSQIKNRKFTPTLITHQRTNQQGVGGGSSGSSSNQQQDNNQQQQSSSLSSSSSSSSPSQMTNPNSNSNFMSRRRFPRRRFYNDFDDDDSDSFLSPFSMTSPFNQFLSDLSNFYTPSLSSSTSNVLPDIKVDVHKEKDKYVVKAEMPGIDKDAVNVEVENGFLTISGEKKIERNEEDKNKKRIYSERSYGKFQRAFQLPDDILQDKIDAKFENGILTLDIHRQPEKIQQEQKKKITIS